MIDLLKIIQNLFASSKEIISDLIKNKDLTEFIFQSEMSKHSKSENIWLCLLLNITKLGST